MGDVGKALIVAIFTGLCKFDGMSAQTMLSRPLICGTVMGFLLGDIATGLYVGASLEFIYLGSVGIGAAIPPDSTSATCIAVAFCVISGIDKDVAVSFAIPVASFTQLLGMLWWTINIGVIHAADKTAETGNIDGMAKWHFLGGFLLFLTGFIPGFVAVAFGAPQVEALVNATPAWVLEWLRLAGNMLPAVGFGILFIMMDKPKLTPFFMIGYVIAAAMGGTLISTAIIGLAAALLYVNQTGNEATQRRARRMSDTA